MAKRLGIKYSTAKTLIRSYSANFEIEDQQLVKAVCTEFTSQTTPKVRCGYAPIT